MMKKIMSIILGILAVVTIAGFFFFRSLTHAETDLNKLDLKNLSGKQVVSAELLSKPLIINYWATWCAPCRQEFPEFQRVKEKLGDKINVVVISDESKSTIEKFKKNNTYTFDYLISDKKLNMKIRPVTVFYNRKGEAVKQLIGTTTEEEILKIVNSMK
ncbi:TlpA family protein disulfide reductase [Chryseobacterium kwangjuense]|nr:TlpA disulfide reductase family protein [Chryseobacterium kwangjuense]